MQWKAPLRRGLIIVGALACLSAAKVPPAQKKAHDLEVARKHLEKAKRSYNLGEYDRAIKEWKFAYNYRADAALLFNIAQAHRLARHFEEAAHSYEMYLQGYPQAPNKAEVRAQIDAMMTAAHPQAAAGSETSGH